jgi:hypothetical protein
MYSMGEVVVKKRLRWGVAAESIHQGVVVVKVLLFE